MAVTSQADWDDCVLFFTANKKPLEDDVSIRLNLNTGNQIPVWIASLRRASENFPSTEDLRKTTLDTYQIFENAMIEFALKAEQGAVVTLDTTKKFLNKLAKKLGTDELPYLNRLQGSFGGSDTLIVKIVKGEEAMLTFTLINNGNIAWPADSKLYLTTASNVITLVNTVEPVGLVEPGSSRTLSVPIMATKEYSGKFQGFFKLTTEEPVMPTLLPLIIEVVDEERAHEDTFEEM